MDLQVLPPRGGVQAADTVLSVLEAVAFSPEPLGVTQIAAMVGAAKGATFRHLRTLLDRGYVVQDPITSRFRLGLKAFSLGREAPVEWDLAAVLAAPMREMRDTTGLSVVLSTPTVQGACVLATIAGTQMIEIGVRIGSHLAMHASAQGKIFLAFGRLPYADQLMHGKLPRYTDHTITTTKDLLAEIDRVRKSGYASAPEEVLLGINTLAAPVYDGNATLVAAVAIVGSIQHIAAVPGPHLVEQVINLGTQASRIVGNQARAGSVAFGRAG